MSFIYMSSTAYIYNRTEQDLFLFLLLRTYTQQHIEYDEFMVYG